MQTNLLLDDSQMNKLSNEESQKVYKEMVKQNQLDQNAAKEDREKAEKAQQETKAPSCKFNFSTSARTVSAN